MSIVKIIVCILFWLFITPRVWDIGNHSFILRLVSIGVIALYTYLMYILCSMDKPEPEPKPAPLPEPEEPEHMQIVKTWLEDLPPVSHEFFQEHGIHDGEYNHASSLILGTPGSDNLYHQVEFEDEFEAGDTAEKDLAAMTILLLGADYANLNIDTYWTLSIPNDDSRDVRYVDAAFLFMGPNNKPHIILVDAIQLPACDNGWYEHPAGSNHIHLNNPENNYPGVFTFDFFMATALTKYREYFPECDVEAVILLCPTEKGLAGVRKEIGLDSMFLDGESIPLTQSWEYLSRLQDVLMHYQHNQDQPEIPMDIKNRLYALCKG